jgi:hypothetical protein
VCAVAVAQWFGRREHGVQFAGAQFASGEQRECFGHVVVGTHGTSGRVNSCHAHSRERLNQHLQPGPS